MAEELKTLTEELDKDQPLTGDSLALLQGAQARRQRIATALRSRGYYDARITATVANQSVEDAAALDAIDRTPEADKTHFVFDVATGPVYRVTDLAIQGPPDIVGYPGLDRSKLTLAPGKPADATLILATEDEILGQVKDRGYALAGVVRREVLIDHATREAQGHLRRRAGTADSHGAGALLRHREGRHHLPAAPRAVSRREIPTSPAKVNALRDRLTSLGVFNSVRVKQATALDDKGELPIDVELTDRVPRTIGFGLSYETIRGFAVNGYWMHRNLFGQAESLKLSAEVNHIGQGNIAAGFWLRLQDRLPQARLVAEAAGRHGECGRGERGLRRLHQKGREPGGRASTASSIRTGGPRSASRGEVSQITRYGITGYYKLIGVPMQVILNEADSDVEPTKGYRLTLNVTPYYDFTNPSDPFVIARLTGTTYLNVSGDGRSVLAGRASFGSIPGGTADNIPFDKLFYAGGGGSVRGFAYQSAGPRDALNNPLGGASVVEGSVEFRQRIGKSFGAVAFVDAGSAYTDTIPNFSQFAPRIGTGAGVRYYTDFGPARLDVGVPLNKRDGDAPFGIYVSIGQAF